MVKRVDISTYCDTAGDLQSIAAARMTLWEYVCDFFV